MNKDWFEYDANWEWAVKFYLRIFRYALLLLCFLLSPKVVGTIIIIHLILLFKKRVFQKKYKDDVVEHSERKITFQDYMEAQRERIRKEYEKELTHTGKHKTKKAFQKESHSDT